MLRTAATIAKFTALPAPEGGQPPVLKYFAALMESGKLNKVESIELARPALAQGRAQLIEKWLADDKITCSEGLGDMVLPLNPKLALAVYLRAGDAHEKVVQCLLATGETAKIVPYCAKAGFRPNFLYILQVRDAAARVGRPLSRRLAPRQLPAGAAPRLHTHAPPRPSPQPRRRLAEPRALQREGRAGVRRAACEGPRGQRPRPG